MKTVSVYRHRSEVKDTFSERRYKRRSIRN